MAAVDLLKKLMPKAVRLLACRFQGLPMKRKAVLHEWFSLSSSGERNRGTHFGSRG
jgi:hypothetical protein